MALADLLAQLNVVNCVGDVGTTGLAGCTFDWKRITAIELSSPSFRYEDAQTLEYIQEQQVLGNLHILKGFETFANVTPDPNIDTVEGSGFKTVVGEMPYEYNGTVNNGVANWKGMRSFKGKDRWNVAFYDAEDNKIFVKTRNSQVKGFSVKMFFVGAYKGYEGNNSAMQSVILQLADVKEMELQQVISSDKMDFSVSEIDGINGVEITMNPVADASTTLTFTAKLQDRTHNAEGLLVTDFNFTKDGVAIVPTLLTYADGTYTATVPSVATAEVYTVSLPNTFVLGVGYRSVLNGTVVVS